MVAGAIDTIEKYSPSIIFEYDPDLLRDLSSSPFQRLRQSGYELFGVYKNRHRITGRGNLELERLQAPPTHGTDILAVSVSMFPAIGSLVRN